MDLSAYSLSGKDVTLEEFRDLMRERATFFEDENIQVSDLSLDRRKLKPTLIRRSLLNLLDDPSVPDEEKEGLDAFYPMQDHAVTLLCNRLKIPYKYFRRCLERLDHAGVRFDAHMNFWLELRHAKKFLVRFDKIHGMPEIRAVLSERYVDLSNVEIADELISALPNHSDYSMRFEWTPKYCYGNIASDKTKVLANGKELAGGIRIKNSEVGLSSAVCELMVLSKTDRSGAILPGYEGFRRTHLQRKDDFRLVFQSSVQEIVDKMDGALSKMASMESIKIHDAHDLIQTLFETNSLDLGQIEAVNQTAVSNQRSSLYDIIQIFILAGADLTLTAERREKLQKIAGEIMMNVRKYGRWQTQS